MTGAGYRVARSSDDQQVAQLARALRQLARDYRTRAKRPGSLGDRLNRDLLLELAAGAEEFVAEIEAPVAQRC